MQFTTILTSLVLAATAIQAIPSYNTTITSRNTTAAINSRTAVNASVNTIELESRNPKDCIARACECNFSSGRRCAIWTNEYGFCTLCPATDPDDDSSDRTSVKCIGLTELADRHKC